MRAKSVLAVLLAASAMLLVLPLPAAAGGDGRLTLTLSERWQSFQPGGWSPYVATVRNDGPADFNGSVELTPVTSNRGPAGNYPDYRARIFVPRGSERSVTVEVLEPPAGYEGRLVGEGGRVLAEHVAPAGGQQAGVTVGILSDQVQAAAKIEALRPLAAVSAGGSQVVVHASRFASAQAFPTSAVNLSGLQALVIDDFDASALSDAQVRAVREFVGLGGSLVVAGGAAWRRTLLPLGAQALGALRPDRSEQLSARPLAELAGLGAAPAVPAAAGQVTGGRAILGDPAGPPLAVESAYGAGTILDLAFDPLDQVFSSDGTGLAQVAWTLILARQALPATAAGNRFAPSSGMVFGKAVPGAPGVPAQTIDFFSVLADTPSAQAPPVGVLGGMLILYILVAGPLSYLALKAAGRRELLWAAVPGLALLFTVAAYAWGSQLHGDGYYDSQAQVLRLGPDGVVEQHGYHGVFAPRHGDFTVELAPGVLATTAVAQYGPAQSALVDTGERPRVQVRGAAYSSMRTLQTLSVTRAPQVPAAGVEAHLKLVQGRLQGSLRNTGERPLRSLVLVAGTGQVAAVPGVLAAHSGLAVDAPSGDVNAGAPPAGPRAGVPSTGSYKSDSLLRLAVAAATTGRRGDLAVVGLTDAGPELLIAGRAPAGSGVAAFQQPVGIEASDTVAGTAAAQLVASAGSPPWHRDVYDAYLPSGFPGTPSLTLPAGSGTSASSSGVRGVEVYDWQLGTWSVLALQGAPSQPQAAPLPTGAYAGGLVRVRLDESGTLQATSSMIGFADR